MPTSRLSLDSDRNGRNRRNRSVDSKRSFSTMKSKRSYNRLTENDDVELADMKADEIAHGMLDSNDLHLPIGFSGK